ncbi:ABC transporter ATP-binding protein/permease [[Bacteroides] pectinophilus]|uniref:ABC transporter domain-containing protein n=1 Tax=[Bacteroides] pectinophilus ATCC 43243 TaxID=483218 RepID=B7ARI9_9FIRM|nr:ABC transporter, ATP-binding protein [[Bacteroides] pectinophilus ATCC 43243]UWN95268.1 ABC transporter ATP-binding protein/permease [[Bacteroides] pectinophilus]
MGKIFRNLAPYWKSVIIILALLAVQAFCDLAMPQYTSDIIDTGIQNGGIAYSVPQSVTQTDFEEAELFMTDEQAGLWKKSYDLEEDGIYRLNISKKKDITAVQNELLVPILINYQLKDDERVQFIQAAKAGLAGKDAVIQMQDKASQMIDSMGASLVSSMGVAYAKQCDANAGMDMNKIQLNYLLAAGGKMVGLALIMAAATVLVGLAASRVAAGVGMTLRGNLFKKVVGFSNTEMDKFSTASLITRCTNDVQQIQMVTVIMLRIVAYAPIIGIGGIIKVLNTGSHMEWVIGLAVLLIMGFVLVLTSIAMPKFKLMQKLVDKVNLVSREILTGLSVIRAFGREDEEEKRFDAANTELTKTNLFTNRVMTFMMPGMMFIMYVITVLIVWVSAHHIDAGTMQVGTMTAFMTYAMQIVMAFLMLTMLSIMLPRAAVAADRIDEVMKTASSVENPDNPVHVEDKAEGKVRFNHVNFRYPNAEDCVLENIDFEALPGQTTAIIGSTGCGKSTLVNLIPRLYDVTEGSITIDGTDIRDMSLEDLRGMIGFVPQKAVLFSGTIASNIKFGNSDASDDDMKQCAQIAQATEFIEEKDDTYNSRIAQGGSNVSGGQKQRLSIARAIAKHPKIFVFDDSFSALDLKTDAALRKALGENVRDSTMIIVAQRVSTILHAEQIIVLDEGRIAGIGTHGQLLENCEVYKEIAMSQLSEEELKNAGKEEN